MDNITRLDIVTIELNSGTIHRSWLNHSIGSADIQANAFGVDLVRDGQPVDLTGGSVFGYFRDPQGNNIAITTGYTIDGNRAYVVLPQACYNYEGQFVLAIKVIGGGVTGTMRIVDGMVDNTNTGGAVAPTETVPTYSEILAEYDAMVAATTAANTAAANVGAIVASAYSTSATYAVGDYCTKDGNLYRCITAITSGESWTAAHWTAVSLGNDVVSIGKDVSDLKSALGTVPAGKTAQGQIDVLQANVEAIGSGGYYEVEKSFTSGGYISASDGSVVQYGHWNYTDYIDISNREENEILVYNTAPDNHQYNAYYNAEKVFISNFNASVGEITPPVSAKYVRMSVQEAYTCGIKTYVGSLASKLSKEDYIIAENKEKTEILYDLQNVTAMSCFEPGGLEVGSGLPFSGQLYRIRSAFTFTNKDIIVSRKQTPSESIGYIVFVWNGNTPNVAADTISGWKVLGADDYTIPKGKYYRVLVAYWNESSHMSDVITNVYDSELFLCINLGNTGEEPVEYNSIIALNKIVEPYVQTIKATYPELAKPYFSATHDPLTFMHFSDIHNIPVLWKRAVQYCDTYKTYIPFALCTGDYVGDNQLDYTDLYDYYMPSIPFLNCVGNHDTYADGNHTLATKQSVYEKLFNHQTGWGVTFEDNITYSMTYYKDFTSSNVRLIVLDNYYDVDAQKTWLASLLEDARTHGMHVITAAHQVTARPSQKIACTFQTLIPYESAGAGFVVDTPFDAVIGAFIANGGKHIVHLAGHEHIDFLYKTLTGVLNCAVECATYWMGWTEGARVANTKSWDCFNVVGVDTDLGILKIVRIGANSDSHNRAKNILSYDYINGNVIYNA